MTTGTSGSVATSAGKQVSASEIGSLWSGKRFYIAALLFLNLSINFTDRINLSVAGSAIAKDFGWDARKMWLLLSSYQWTYCLFLLPWGWVIDRMGTRLVVGLSVTIWSISGILTGVSTTFGGCRRPDWPWERARPLPFQLLERSSDSMVANQYLLLLLISISEACISSALSLNIALASDLVWHPDMVGTAIGFLILGGNIFGSLVPIATVYIVQLTDSFDLAFYLAGFLLFLAELVFFTMTRKPLNFEESVA